MRPRPPGFVGRYINTRRSTPDVEARLSHNVPILREPFNPVQLRAAVRYLLA